jgi:hypothetical protein
MPSVEATKGWKDSRRDSQIAMLVFAALHSIIIMALHSMIDSIRFIRFIDSFVDLFHFIIFLSFS